MAYKDYGPNTSEKPEAVTPGGGSFTAEDRSYETVVAESNRPLIDWENNLLQEVCGDYGLRRRIQNSVPSCFLEGDFLETSSGSGSFVVVAPDPGVGSNANKIQLKAANLVVNGWQIRFEFCEVDTAGMNQFTLPVPPASGIRTDFVFLEVWRANLAPTPDTTNKSPTGQIYRHGNAKAPDAAPNVNLADDILDVTYGQESQRRVQIQYRFRVFGGVDFDVYPNGLDDPALFAHTVPYHAASGVDGNVLTYNYAPHPTDPGLWVAGENNATGVTNVGSVDGLIYAIPLFVVFRRNSTAFDRSTNPNGGALMASGTSDRPDGLYSDQIVLEDVLDLRKGVAHDFRDVLEKATQQLFDNSLSTQHEVSAIGTGGVKTFLEDSIGVSAKPGNPDGVRVRYSDRSVIESVVCEVALAASNSLSLDLSSLPISWAGAAVNVLANSPNASIFDAYRVRIDDPSIPGHDALVGPSNPPYVTSITYSTVIGPGIDHVNIQFSANLTATVFVELLVTYPSGSGLTRSPSTMSDVWTPPAASVAAWVDPTTLTATSDVNRYSLDSSLWWADVQHRELTMRLKSTPNVRTLQSTTGGTVWIPDTVTGSVTVNDGTNPPYSSTSYAPYQGYTELLLTPDPGAGTAVQVTYEALRPAPPVTAPPNDSYDVFYYGPASQSVGPAGGDQTLKLIPRAIPNELHCIMSGAGSPDSSFPYPGAGTQIPNALGYSDSRMDSPGTMTVDGMSLMYGYARIQARVPYAPNVGEVQLFRSILDPVVDSDGRNFWPRSHDPSGPDAYSPVAAGPPLTAFTRHKVAMPFLAEVKEDLQNVGRKGTLVLVVVTKWGEYTKENDVSLTSNVGDTCAAVYRVRGNLMNPRRSDV